MKTIVKLLQSFNLFSFFALNLFLLFALNWIVWGEFIPQADSLGLMGFVGLFVALAIFNTVLESIPERVKIRRYTQTPNA